MNTSGEARTLYCMIIPVHYTDGYGYDDFFVQQVDKMMNGKENYSARQFYLNASYGKIDLQYELMPVHDMGVSSAQEEALWQKDFDAYSDHYWQIYNAARRAYKGDLSKFDSDGDGYADMVIMVFDDPSVDGVSRFGTLYGGKCVSMNLNKVANNADHDYPSCRGVVCVERWQMMPDDGIGEEWRWAGDTLNSWNVLIHEIGHRFGVPDLYADDAEGYGMHTPLGFDMHDTEVGDLGIWTKLAYGWVDPYVITPDVEEVTLRLRCSARYPDCILIPTSAGWNGTPFDEYMLVDVLGKVGNSLYQWDSEMLEFTSSKDAARYGGVRILHVDQRLVYIDDDGRGAAMFDPSELEHYNKKLQKLDNADYYQLWSLNTMGIGVPTEWSMGEDNAYYFKLHTMKRLPEDPYFLKRENNRGIFDLCACDLFVPGTSFSMATHGEAFANAPYMNNHAAFDYEIIVEAYDSLKMEAVVTVKKTAQ